MNELKKELNPIVSVLTPVYNTKKYLNECIKSLLNQQFTDFEIIVLDDGSTDGSSKALDQLALCDERMKVVHKDNSGYGDTMNLGISTAKGSYIAILESDDYAEPYMLKVLYDAAAQTDADLVLANYYMDHVAEDGLSLIKTEPIENLAKVNYSVYLTEEERKRLAYSTPALWRCLYKKDYLIRKNISFLPTKGASFQDTSFFIKAVMMTEKAVHIPDKVLHYRRGQMSASVKDSSKVYCICDELAEITRYIADQKLQSWQAICPLILYYKYLWNYNRLSEPLKSEFMHRFQIDMIAMDLNGWLDKSVWPEWRYKQMIELLNYEKIRPLKVRRVKYMNANQQAKLTRFIATLALHDEIVLYGAGIYGDLLLQRIYDWCLYKKVKFAVTNEPEEPVHKGIDVFPIEYFRNCTANYVIVISVGEALTGEMVKILDGFGLTNYITLDDDLRKALKEDAGLQERKNLWENIKTLRDALNKETEKLKASKESNELLKNSNELLKKSNDILNNMLSRMRDENELLRESYMKVNQLEKRLDKLEEFMREEETCRLNTDKILKILSDTNKV